MSTSRRAAVAVIVTLLLLVALAGAGFAWFFAGDEPAPVDLDAAASSVGSSSPSSSPDASGTSGAWIVDAASGEFDFESATGTFAGFRIEEELQSIGSTTAVGRTGDVTGSATIDGTTLTAATFTVDLTSITTNERRRDDKVQSALETDEFPTATFALTEPIDLGRADGAVSVTAVGELTIHGVTKAVELPLEAKLVGDTIVVVGSTSVRFSDYGVSVPSSPVVLSVDDVGTVEVQLLLVRDAT